jgi:outer membrane receptor protein involved in Fe transport
MRRLILVCFLIVLFWPLALAQSNTVRPNGKLKGIVKDKSEDSPLQYATVSVFNEDSTLAGGGIAAKDGSFSVDLKAGEYYAVVQFISYEKQTIQNIKISDKNPIFNTGIISLNQASSTLSEVTVTAEKSQMLVELDRKVFNVGKDLSSTGKSALEILDNIPSVAVDVDGNISLRGSQDLQILVDGKPSGLYNSDNPDALKNLPGSMIERVEVITNPSAKYEAKGMVGIINIILKKDQRKGVNGSFDITAGYPQDYGASVNVNFRREKINYYLNYGIRYNERPGVGHIYQRFYNLSDTLATLTRSTNTDQNRLRKQLSNNFRGGFDYTLNSKNTLTAEFTMGLNNENDSSKVQYWDYNAANTLSQYTKRIDLGKNIENEVELSLNYTKTFDQKDKKLTAVAQFFDNNESSHDDITQDSINYVLYPPAESRTLQKTSNNQDEQNLLLQADYTQPFGDAGKIETGYRSEFRRILNPYEVTQEDSTGNWQSLPGFTNNFEYDENVYALYLQGSEKFKKISIQLGLRAEYTDVHTYLKETEVSDSYHYLDPFPTIHTTYQLDDRSSLQLSYSRRINRPQPWALNPFHTYSDSRNIRAGNPNLKPEYTDALEGGYLYNKNKVNLYAGVYYRYTKDPIERVDTGNLIRYTLPVNLTQKQSFGGEANLTIDPVKWWTLSGNINFYRFITEGNYAKVAVKSDDFTWDSRINSRFRLPKDLDIQFIFTYRGPQQTTQGTNKAFYMLNAGLSKDLFKNKATLTFNVRDILNSRRFRNVVDLPDYYAEREFRWGTRSYSLTFTYRLNQKKKIGKQGDNGGNSNGEGMDF